MSLLGVMIAGYLWWAHIAHADLPCGGAGDCDQVRNSPYSRFPFGKSDSPPVAAYGTLGYLALTALSFLRTLTTDGKRDRALLALILVGAALGTAASLYLTYLEIFVIKAICRWCVASQTILLALLITAGLEWLRTRRNARPASAPLTAAAD